MFFLLLFACGMLGAYLRDDVVGFSIFGGFFSLVFLIFSLRRMTKNNHSSGSSGKSAITDAQIAKSQLNDHVRWVASGLTIDWSEFRSRAKTVATALPPTSIDHLASLFHLENSPPPALENAFPALGQWITARQFAIFEIFYCLGEPSIPTLKRVAFGDYDWTQGNAIEILCRLAADDVNREDIVEALIVHLASIREEAHCYALGPLLSQAEANHGLKKIIERLLVVPEFRENYERFTNATP
jgi:hypothetical protein